MLERTARKQQQKSLSLYKYTPSHTHFCIHSIHHVHVHVQFSRIESLVVIMNITIHTLACVQLNQILPALIHTHPFTLTVGRYTCHILSQPLHVRRCCCCNNSLSTHTMSMQEPTHQVILGVIEDVFSVVTDKSWFADLRHETSQKIAALVTVEEQLKVVQQFASLGSMRDAIDWKCLFLQTPFDEVCRHIVQFPGALDAYDLHHMLEDTSESVSQFKQELIEETLQNMDLRPTRTAPNSPQSPRTSTTANPTTAPATSTSTELPVSSPVHSKGVKRQSGKTESNATITFVRWSILADNVKPESTCWVQWTGNEDKLRRLQQCTDAQSAHRLVIHLHDQKSETEIAAAAWFYGAESEAIHKGELKMDLAHISTNFDNCPNVFDTDVIVDLFSGNDTSSPKHVAQKKQKTIAL